MARLGITVMIESGQSTNPAMVGEWYVDTVSLIAYSRLCLELMRGVGARGGSSGLVFNDPNACGDYKQSDPHRTGFHINQDTLNGAFGLDWPAARRVDEWYEGEAIFLQVSRPADPTDGFVEKYEDFYKERFVLEGFASVVPRLKREVWEAPA